jgi:hypothetical protein
LKLVQGSAPAVPAGILTQVGPPGTTLDTVGHQEHLDMLGTRNHLDMVGH